MFLGNTNFTTNFVIKLAGIKTSKIISLLTIVVFTIVSLFLYSASTKRENTNLQPCTGSGNCNDKKEDSKQQKQNYILRRFISYNQSSVFSF